MAALLASVGCSVVYPPGWHQAPNRLENFKARDTYVINPWLYLHRLGAYKIMIEQTAFSMESFGSDNSGNILWGLPLQFGWQFSSERTRDLSNMTSCGFSTGDQCISYNSWWASMNYYLSIVPFLGMIHAQYFQVPPSSIRIMSPGHDAHLYCNDFNSCNNIQPRLVTRWSEFFTLLKNESLRRDLSTSALKDKYLTAMWRAHVESIETALPLFKGKESWMSDVENSFGTNWANLVHFIATTHFSTDNKNTVINQIKYLPQRLLWDSDKPPKAPGLTSDQNKALIVFQVFDKLNYYTEGWLLRVWQKTMCTPRRVESDVTFWRISYRIRSPPSWIFSNCSNTSGNQVANLVLEMQ
ncbi:protein LEG1 homolog [Liolophura sinensis]|uniref:protein LEG1 homolog n=1 Tax=Liolophura sinensis TaxID=3198878 RepID=UPI003158A9F5